jgi:hypothetical protein
MIRRAEESVPFQRITLIFCTFKIRINFRQLITTDRIESMTRGFWLALTTSYSFRIELLYRTGSLVERSERSNYSMDASLARSGTPEVSRLSLNSSNCIRYKLYGGCRYVVLVCRRFLEAVVHD